MRIVAQRVSSASVVADGELTGSIGHGLMLLVGFSKKDTEDLIPPVVEKITKLRVFPGEKGFFDKDIVESQGEILVVSQFTLYGETLKGRRPDFAQAMESGRAKEMYDKFVTALEQGGVQRVATGKFGAMMQVSIVNEGPTTLIIER